jgi:hypothetical protein
LKILSKEPYGLDPPVPKSRDPVARTEIQFWGFGPNRGSKIVDAPDFRMIRICNSGQKRRPEGTRVDRTPLCQRPSRGSSLAPFSRSEIRKNKDAEKKKDSANEIGQKNARPIIQNF